MIGKKGKFVGITKISTNKGYFSTIPNGFNKVSKLISPIEQGYSMAIVVEESEEELIFLFPGLVVKIKEIESERVYEVKTENAIYHVEIMVKSKHFEHS